MSKPLRAALRERLRPVPVLLWLALIGGLYAVLDGSPKSLAATVASAVVLGAADLLTDACDLREAVERLALGLYTLVAGGTFAVVADSSAGGAVTLAVGGWFALDGVQTIRHEGLYDDESDDRDGREVYREYLARRIDEALREGPRTRLELHDALDADGDEIDRAVDALLDRGRIERAGSELRVPDRSEPRRKRAVDAVGSLLRRLARPVTVEFRRETP